MGKAVVLSETFPEKVRDWAFTKTEHTASREEVCSSSHCQGLSMSLSIYIFFVYHLLTHQFSILKSKCRSQSVPFPVIKTFLIQQPFKGTVMHVHCHFLRVGFTNKRQKILLLIPISIFSEVNLLFCTPKRDAQPTCRILQINRTISLSLILYKFICNPLWVRFGV